MADLVASLLAEREGYVRRGMKDRVADVDKALDALGYVRKEEKKTEAAALDRETERAVTPRAPKRKA